MAFGRLVEIQQLGSDYRAKSIEYGLGHFLGYFRSETFNYYGQGSFSREKWDQLVTSPEWVTIKKFGLIGWLNIGGMLETTGVRSWNYGGSADAWQEVRFSAPKLPLLDKIKGIGSHRN